jgi:hypothetical protein
MMGQNSDLIDYLRQHLEEGVQDSEGAFTISREDATRKLARFSLPRQTAWVSKLVQAAVGWDCRRLVVDSSMYLTTFYFEMSSNRELVSEAEVVTRLLSPLHGSDDPLECFCIALRALVEQANLSFLLVLCGPESETKPICAGRYFEKLDETAQKSETFRRGEGLTLTVAEGAFSPLKWLTRQGLKRKVAEELRAFCYTSPVPIGFEGEQIDGSLEGLCQDSRLFRPLRMTGLTGLKSSPNHLPLFQGAGDKEFSLCSDWGSNIRDHVSVKDVVFGALLLVGAHVPDSLPSEVAGHKLFAVDWVRQGVIVDSHALDQKLNFLGGRLLLNASGLKGDLTGFQLVKNQGSYLRASEVVRAAHQELSSLDFLRNALRVIPQEGYDSAHLEARRELFEGASLDLRLQTDLRRLSLGLDVYLARLKSDSVVKDPSPRVSVWDAAESWGSDDDDWLEPEEDPYE